VQAPALSAGVAESGTNARARRAAATPCVRSMREKGCLPPAATMRSRRSLRSNCRANWHGAKAPSFSTVNRCRRRSPKIETLTPMPASSSSDPEIARLRVGGRFRTGDMQEFFDALQTALPVSIRHTDSGLVFIDPRR